MTIYEEKRPRRFLQILLLVIFLILISVIAIILYRKIFRGNFGLTKKSNNSVIYSEKKIINVKSKDGKITGVIGLMPYEKNPKYVLAVYNLKFKDELKENWACKNENPSLCTKYVEYTYGINLKESKDDNNEGTLSNVQCQKDWNFTDPFTLDSQSYAFSKCFNGSPTANRITKPTDTFFAWFTKTYSDYEQYKNNNLIELYDLQNFWNITEKTKDSQTWSVDIPKAMRETKPIVTYELEFTN
jgi:hypothetical protein